MARGDTFEPAFGQPSLTPGEITDIYQEAFGRPPTSSELSSELENANKYSAAGIERQIRLRASNTAGSGIRGDEGLPPLTMPRPVRNSPPPPPPIADAPPPPTASIVTAGPGVPAGTAPPTVGPTGLANPNAPLNYATMQYGDRFGYNGSPYTPSVSPGAFAQPDNTMTWIILGGVALAVYFLFIK